jgi:type IV secretory pathway VirB2 component (pilin)
MSMDTTLGYAEEGVDVVKKVNGVTRTLAIFNLVLAGAVLVSGYANAAETAAAVSPVVAVKSFWEAISPAINDAALYAYAITWLAAFMPKATEESGVAWRLIRTVIDLLAANVKNASNVSK